MGQRPSPIRPVLVQDVRGEMLEPHPADVRRDREPMGAVAFSNLQQIDGDAVLGAAGTLLVTPAVAVVAYPPDVAALSDFSHSCPPQTRRILSSSRRKKFARGESFLPRFDCAIEIAPIEPQTSAVRHPYDGNVPAQRPIAQTGVRHAEVRGGGLGAEQPIGIRRQNAERNLNADGTPRRGQDLTANRKSEIADYKRRQYAALEEQIQENFAACDPEAGRYVVRIPDSARADIGRRKVEIEDSAREMLGQPSLLQAEQQLVGDPSKAADLQKIRKTYKDLTGIDTPIARIQSLPAIIKRTKDSREQLRLTLELTELRARFERDPQKQARYAEMIRQLRERLR